MKFACSRSTWVSVLVANFCLLWLAACASAPSGQSTAAVGVPPAVEGRVPTEYRQVDASAPAIPSWVLTTPDDADGVHYLVALSEYHASEQDARETAMKNARLEYARYTGVAVSEVDEVIRSLYGKSSEVLDPTVAARTQSRQQTDAEVSRIKAKQWYRQTFQATRGGVSQGQVYKYYVLVTVPTDEIERVQQWRRSRQASLQQARQRLEQQAATELTAALEENRRQLGRVDEELSEGELVSALVTIKDESDRLARIGRQFRERGGPFADGVMKLDAAQRTTLNRIEQARSSLVIDVGHCGSACALSGARSYVLPVWVFCRIQEKLQPVSGLPLQLSDGSGAVQARATTDAGGRAEFRSGQLKVGRQRVSIDINRGLLTVFDPQLMKGFAAVENYVQVTAPGNFDGAIQNAVNRLFAAPGHLPLPVERVILGPVTFAGNGLGSELALAIQRQLRLKVTRIAGLTVIEPKPRNVQVVAQAVTRGIALHAEQGAKDEKTPGLGSPAIQAVIDGAQAALEATYSVTDGKVILDLSLREAGTDRLLAAAAATIPENDLPAGMPVLPLGNAQDIPRLAEATQREIHLQVSSHLGDGQTFQAGDVISWFVSADRDAYLLLIYQDAAGNLIRILPNRYSGTGFFPAGRYLQIPAPGDRFEFTITAPFGRERILAFASTRPYPRLPETELDNGLYLLREDLESVVRQLRKTGTGSGNYYGEAQAAITTVAAR